METITLLQHYWWLIISLLGALLVFLLFVQGGQGLLYCLGRTEEERNMLVNSLGRKWEFTFTTLVTFGGAFFASSIISYSISSSFCTFSSAIVIPYPFLLSEPRPQPANTSRAADDTSPSRAPWSMKCAGARAQRTKAPCRARRRTHPYK